VRAGDDRAFEELFGRYADRIKAYVNGMVRDHARAEDITQEVFFNALRRMRETDRSIAFRPWIYEIAKNACIDAHRRARRAQEISYDADDGLAAADQGRLVSPRAVADAVETRESLESLQGALGALSESHVDVLVLREMEGLSYQEIGERLGMSRASVESTLFRARKRLEAEYNDLVSGERCRQIQALLGAGGGRPRLRDRRQVSRHLAWCQACRRQARLAGVEVAPRVPLRTKVGGLIPVPAFLQRLLRAGSTTGQVAGAGDSLLEWGRAAAAAAVVAVAGVGAGTLAQNAPVVDAHGYAPGPSLYGQAGATPPGLRQVAALVGTDRGLGGGGVAVPPVPGGGAGLGAPVTAGPLGPAGGGPASPTAPASGGPAAGLPAGLVSGQTRAAGSAVAGAAGGLTGTTGAVAGGVSQTAGAAVGGLTGTVGGTVRDTGSTVGGAVRDLGGTAGGAVRNIGQTTNNAVGGVTRTAGNLVRDVTRDPANTGQAVNDALRGTTRTAGRAVRDTSRTAGEALGGTTQTVTNATRGATDTVDHTVRSTTNTVRDTVDGVNRTTSSAVQGVTNTVQGVTQSATTQAAPPPQPAGTTAQPPAPANPVQTVVQDTTGALGGLLGGR
jgi:RNA polymerase sigma factor (sigma-70 family)